MLHSSTQLSKDAQEGWPVDPSAAHTLELTQPLDAAPCLRSTRLQSARGGASTPARPRTGKEGFKLLGRSCLVLHASTAGAACEAQQNQTQQ